MPPRPRLYATLAELPPQKPRMNSAILPRLNVLGSELQPAPVGLGPTTGFFRNNYCDASPMDPASHTVAALITPSFLRFSASRGNDLSSLFPTSGPLSPSSPTSQCTWCLCATRWREALLASATHPEGEAIVPKVFLEATHEEAGRRIGGTEELERFAVGGDGDLGSGGEGAGKVGGGERPGR